MRKILISVILSIAMSGSAVFAGQDTVANLRLWVDRDQSLTIYVLPPDPIYLNGLAFRVVKDQGTFQTYNLDDYFENLRLTEGLALPGSCLIFVQSETSPVLPEVCGQQGARMFRLEIAPADVFWYDFVTNRQRDVAIVINNKPTGEICPASAVECSFTVPPLGFTPVENNADWTPVFTELTGTQMVLVPAGCFDMGSTSEQIESYFQQCEASMGAGKCPRDEFDMQSPRHNQCFERPFWVDRTEVTQAQYRRCVDSDACPPPVNRGDYDNPDASNYPVNYVGYLQANAYAAWRGCRLPTEREWEYAARGPDDLIYPWGNTFKSDNVSGFPNGLEAVGSRPTGASWVGAMDMSGNVWELTSSLYFKSPYVMDDGRENPDDTEGLRVRRGGSGWDIGAGFIRSAYRGPESYSGHEDVNDGFRCARDFQPGDVPS